MRQLVSIFMFCILMSSSAWAQEGHPLKGSWIGEWSGNDVHGDFVLIILDWDGEEVTGVINPGTDDMVIEKVKLDPSDWSVSIEAAGYKIDGKIENLGIPSRSIVGTWKQKNRKGSFEISRQ